MKNFYAGSSKVNASTVELRPRIGSTDSKTGDAVKPGCASRSVPHQTERRGENSEVVVRVHPCVIRFLRVFLCGSLHREDHTFLPLSQPFYTSRFLTIVLLHHLHCGYSFCFLFSGFGDEIRELQSICCIRRFCTFRLLFALTLRSVVCSRVIVFLAYFVEIPVNSGMKLKTYCTSIFSQWHDMTFLWHGCTKFYL